MYAAKNILTFGIRLCFLILVWGIFSSPFASYSDGGWKLVETPASLAREKPLIEEAILRDQIKIKFELYKSLSEGRHHAVLYVDSTDEITARLIDEYKGSVPEIAHVNRSKVSRKLRLRDKKKRNVHGWILSVYHIEIENGIAEATLNMYGGGFAAEDYFYKLKKTKEGWRVISRKMSDLIS